MNDGELGLGGPEAADVNAWVIRPHRAEDARAWKELLATSNNATRHREYTLYFIYL